MEYLYLHAPEPQKPRDVMKEEQERNNPYPDYEQSYIVEYKPVEENVDQRVVVIQL